MMGSAEQITAKILDAHAELGIARLIGHFDWGGLPPARVREAIARLTIPVISTCRCTAIRRSPYVAGHRQVALSRSRGPRGPIRGPI